MEFDFKPVTIDFMAMAQAYKFPWKLQNSEYTFTNLLMWSTDECIKLAEYEDALFVLLQYGKEPPFMFAPLTRQPRDGYARAVQNAAAYFKELGVEPLFHAICGPLREAFEEQCPDYALIEDRDNHDYIYNTQDLLYLKGKKFHAKRNHINQFMANYDYEYVEIRPDMLDECMNVYQNWLRNKDTQQPGVLGEREAIGQAIRYMDLLGVKGGGIRIDGQLVAFTLGQRIDDEMAVIHIEKADDSIVGLYAMINQQFVTHEWMDTLYINREEDMGIEGLRKAKLSYHPVKLLEKYYARKRG